MILTNEEIAQAMRNMAADWYADAMRLPPRADHEREVERAKRLAEDLERLSVAVEAGNIAKRPDGLFVAQAPVEKSAESGLRKKTLGILESLADDVVSNGSNGAYFACEDAADEIMEAFGHPLPDDARRKWSRRR